MGFPPMRICEDISYYIVSMDMMPAVNTSQDGPVFFVDTFSSTDLCTLITEKVGDADCVKLVKDPKRKDLGRYQMLEGAITVLAIILETLYDYFCNMLLNSEMV